MSDLVLYSYFRSSASYRARIALYQKNLVFEYKAIHLLNNGGEQNTAAYKSLNPAGEVPTLIHKNNVISQSMAILLYLDDCFQGYSLFSKDAYQKSKIIQFCEGINCTQPYQNLRTLQFLENELEVSEEKKKFWLKYWLGRNLQASENFLQKTAGDFCFGDQVTAADCFLIPQLFAAKRFDVNFEEYSMINKIFKNCSELQPFKKAHPFQQPDTPEEMRPK